MTDNFFGQFQDIFERSDLAESLAQLSDHFRQSDEITLLFESRKMEVRYELGLPLLYSSVPDDLTEDQQRQLEDRLLDICREVGTLLINRGEIAEGWLYLQPVGDRNLQSELFGSVEVDEDNIDELIQVTFFQQAAPEVGYPLLMQRQGTCASITAFERDIRQMEIPIQKQLAELLVNHIYGELVTNVQGHVEEVEKAPAETDSLARLMSTHTWLTEGGNHHLDTTHLASVVRLASIVDDPRTLWKLVELTHYGKSLHQDFQYPSEPPFENTYEDYGVYYRALASRSEAACDDAANHFKKKSETVSRDQHGAVAWEVYVSLLNRLDRKDEAIDAYIKQLYRKEDLTGIAPNIFDIADQPDQLVELSAFFRDRDDKLGFSVALLKARECEG